MALKELAEGLIRLYTEVWPSVRDKFFSGVPRRYWSMDGLPEKPGEFSPFFSEAGPEKIWSRSADLDRFHQHMAKNIHSHTILTGPSGSGKSTFLKRVVKPALGEEHFIFNSSYFDLTNTFIDSIPTPDELAPKRMDLDAEIIEFLARTIKLSINQVLQDTALFPVPAFFRIPPALVEIGDHAETFIREALEGKPTTYFVFDQIERFLSDLKHLQARPDEAIRAVSIYIVIRVFKTLRQLDNTRTIFAIRSDFLFASIDFLSYSLDSPDDADAVFRYFFFNGINISTSRKAINEIRLQYQLVNSPVTWPAFESFTALNSKSVSNTFLTQLSGYMLENFGKSDARVAEIVSSGGTPGDYLQIFFEHLIAGFHQAHRGVVNHNIFKAVVLTIAVENGTSGDAITADRISRLSHIPQRFVDPVVAYLLSRHVLKKEGNSGKDLFRFSHDLLFDHVVDSPEFQGRDDLHKGMERLAEHKIPDSKLIEVPTYGSFFEELQQLQVPALSLLAYWLFAGTLSVSSTWPLLPLGDELRKWDPLAQATCGWLFGIYNRVIDLLPVIIRHFFVVTDCKSIGSYSIAIAIMHIAWLWYIYKLERGYFRYVFFDRPIFKAMAAGLIPLAAAFGMLVGFSPNLCVIPLTVVGLGMSILLGIVAYQVGVNSPFGKLNRQWALRTAMNMIFTALLLVNLHSFMVSNLPAYSEARDSMKSDIFLGFGDPAVIVFWMTSFFLCWFLMHISPEQQSAISMAARLTQFDVTRNQSRKQ
jgi:hypothetical protein